VSNEVKNQRRTGGLGFAAGEMMSINPALMGNQGASDPEEVREWVACAQAGDTAAYERLYRIYVRRIYSLCYRMLAESDWAEEVTQEIFIKAWTALRSFRNESSFFSWLYRLAVNRVLGSIRENRRRVARVFTAEDRVLEQHPGRRTSTEENLDLELAIAGLPERARLVFVLYEIEGYRHDEIAALLGVAEGTCKAQLHRARLLLRKALGR